MSGASLQRRVAIAAPVDVVWRVLTDTEAFADWTDDLRFYRPPLEGQWRAMRVRLFGMPIVVPVHLDAVRPSSELRWRGGPPGVFVGSHYFRITSTEDGGAELIQGEDFQGIAVPVLLPGLRGELMRLYERTNDALKRRAERIHAAT